jgi:bacillithiol biosynthesis deacetylase BshB1
VSVDVVAIAAHPDDVEMTVGGTIAKLVARGRSVGIIDMTRGEMGTRGTPQTREAEAAAAAKVLGVATRVNLDLGDGVLENSLANRVKVIESLRELRPKLVLAPHWEDLHPDHAVAGRIVCDIMYPIGFPKFPAKGQPFRPREFLFYMQHFTTEPSFIVDITGYHDKKMESVRCFASQLHAPGSGEPKTNISQPDFLQKLEARARYFGSQINVEYGEPLVSRRPIPVDDPLSQYEKFGFGM